MSPIELPGSRAQRVHRVRFGPWLPALLLAVALGVGSWGHLWGIGAASAAFAPVADAADGAVETQVSGRLVDPDGLPIGDARVVAWVESGGEVLRLGRATSDASGRFAVTATTVLAGPRSGPATSRPQWWVSVLAPGWVSGEHHPFDPASGAALIELAPETASRVVFGRVVCKAAEPGAAAPGSRVVVVDGRGTAVARTSTDGDGRFVLRGALLGRGDLQVVAHHGRHGLSRFVALPEVGRGATLRMELTLERPLASVEGIVCWESGEPAVDRDFVLHKLAGPADLFAEVPVRSGADGSILVRGLEAGDYELCLAGAPEVRIRVTTAAPDSRWRLPSTDP